MIPIVPPKARPPAPPAVSVPSFLRIAEVCALIRMNRSWVYQEIKDGAFPKPIKLGKRSLWYQREIEAWMEDLAARPR